MKPHCRCYSERLPFEEFLMCVLSLEVVLCSIDFQGLLEEFQCILFILPCIVWYVLQLNSCFAPFILYIDKCCLNDINQAVLSWPKTMIENCFHQIEASDCISISRDIGFYFSLQLIIIIFQICKLNSQNLLRNF